MKCLGQIYRDGKITGYLKLVHLKIREEGGMGLAINGYGVFCRGRGVMKKR